MQDKQWHMLETGLDLRIDEFGRLQIATNTPTGHIYQVLSLWPSTAYALKAWLGGQDWEAIERVATKNDPTASSEFAAVRAHDAGTDEGLPTDRRPCPNCGRSDGWHYALGHPPLPVGDCRKIVWMRDKDEMEWWGVRAYNHAEGYWQSNSREESSTVLFWMETPHSPHYPPASHAESAAPGSFADIPICTDPTMPADEIRIEHPSGRVDRIVNVAPSAEPVEDVVDPITQLAMSLQWEELYTDEYKRRVLKEAIAAALVDRRPK